MEEGWGFIISKAIYLNQNQDSKFHIINQKELFKDSGKDELTLTKMAYNPRI